MDDGSGCIPGMCGRPGKFGGMCADCARGRRNERKRVNRVPVIEAREQAREAAKAAAPPCTPEECFRRGRKGGLCKRCTSRAGAARKKELRATSERFRELEAAERRRHYERHRDEILARGKAWREANPERQRELWTAWYAENREKLLAKLASPEQRARLGAWQRADRAAHPERYREAGRRQRAANPEPYLLRGREASRRRQVGTTYSRILYSTVLERDGMVCHLCGDPIPSLADLHFDHVIPLAKGGEHTLENVRPSHALCNLRKSDRLI